MTSSQDDAILLCLVHFCRRLQAEKSRKKYYVEKYDKTVKRRLKTTKIILKKMKIDSFQTTCKCQSIIEAKLKLFVIYDINFIIFISTTEHNLPVSKEVS